MTKHQGYILIGCVFICTTVLLTLYFASPLSQDLYRAEFDRRFVSGNSLIKEAEVDLETSDYYLAGLTSEKVYLARVTNPLELAIVDIKDRTKKTVNLRFDDQENLLKAPGFKLKIDSPYYFITNGVLPVLFRGRLNEWTAKRFMPDSAYFVEAVPITSNSFALRSRHVTNNQFELAKESKSDKPNFSFKNGLLKKQVDGFFCVEGMLRYDKTTNNVLYLYTYRNQYMVLDTNMNLMHEHHTIDTFSHAMVKVANIESKGYSTLAVPPAQININSWASGKNLFVQSNIMANNEDQKTFERSSTIDIYDFSTGKYLRSFHIPDLHRVKIGDFQISERRLVAIFGQYLVTYELNTEVIDHIQMSRIRTDKDELSAKVE